MTNPPADGIHAVVVGSSTSEHLPVTLRAVADGTRAPDRLSLVLLDGGDVDTSALETRGIAVTIIRSDAQTSGEAYAAGVDESEWTWLLHADSAPAPTCLAELHRVCESSKMIAAAGPKQVGWDDPTELLEVGIRATRSGRRVPELDPGEKDQGQFDTRDDVLAVGTAGMLLRTAALDAAGGFDPALGPFGDGLELSRRLRAAGHRVVVVPSAAIRHARESFADTPHSFGRRRGAQMYTALQRAPLLVAPVLFLLYMVLSPVRALARIALKDTVRARGELWAAVELLRRASALHAARRRLSRATVTRAYRSLEATHRDVIEGRSDIRKARREAEKLRNLPPAHVRREVAERRARTRASASALAVITLALGIAGFAPNLSAFGLSGGGLLPDDSSAGDLLQAATRTWVPAGDGHAGHLEPLWILAIPFTWLAGYAGGTLTEAIYLFFIAAPMLAGLSAFRASGSVATSPTLRFILGAVWAAAPPFLSSLSAGSAGAVLFHIVLPLLAMSFVRAVTTRASSHLGSAAWWTLVAGAAYPAAIVGVAIFAIIAALSQRRFTWLWVPIPGTALAGPALWSMTKSLPESLVRLPGAPFEWTLAERWEVLAGWPMGVETAQPVLLAAAALVVVTAILSLVRVRRARAVRIGWLLVGAGGVLTGFALTQTDGVDQSTLAEAPAWPGPGLSLMWLGLVVAVAGGAHGLRADLSASGLSVRHLLVGACTLGVVGIPVAGSAAWLIAVHGDGTTLVGDAPATMIPAVAAKSATDPARGRTLVLSETEGGYRAELWRGDGPQLTARGQVGGDVLAGALARLGEDDFAELVARHAVTVVLVPGSDADELGTLLDASDSITRITKSEIGTFWRVDVPSGRVMQGENVLESHVVDATVTAEPGVLTLAERDDPGWTAVQDGVELERADDPWRAAWQVEKPGTVHISHDGGFAQWWVTLIRILLIAGNITVSLPWRAR
ncbi:glycosyltransferase [Flaviflexus huanghaiensis]|uniref:glycosyltransferase n=1 Tax=Flaviflexus huanghaiensis TaxID=1111473 RepID=UPI0015FB59AD|nr:glycosyltransferase [Flaviflexus huanghaiensis]